MYINFENGAEDQLKVHVKLQKDQKASFKYQEKDYYVHLIKAKPINNPNPNQAFFNANVTTISVATDDLKRTIFADGALYEDYKSIVVARRQADDFAQTGNFEFVFSGEVEEFPKGLLEGGKWETLTIRNP